MPELLKTAFSSEEKPARSSIQVSDDGVSSAAGWKSGPDRLSMNLNGVRFTLRCGAIAAFFIVTACLPPEEEKGGGVDGSFVSVLNKTASVLKGGLSQDYDPPDYQGPPLGQLPAYFVGDAYTYSTGRTETVTEATEDQVIWVDDLRSHFERYRNFVLPAIMTRTDRGTVTRSFEVAPDMLWPLIPGTRRQFSSDISIKLRNKKGRRVFRRDWVCTVVGQERVKVQFGVFDSVKIDCDRYAHGSWQQTRTWYFVPEIGHYVRRVDKYLRSENRDVELVSIQQTFDGISTVSRRGVYDLEQRTLEGMPSGEPASWQSPDGRLKVTMTVAKTLRTEAGQFCRTFRQYFDDGENPRFVPGLACRTWNGRWVRL